MDPESFSRIYRMGVRLMGYGIIALGIGAMLHTYLRMLVRLDEAEPDKTWELLNVNHLLP